MVIAAFERSQAVIQKSTKSDPIHEPTDTELVMDKIAAEGNFNEDGGELGDDDWPVA